MIDLPLIDCHTHIGHLPGVLGDRFTPEDLSYIAEHEGARFMLASSATTSLVGQAAGTDEAIAMLATHGARLGALLWVNPRDGAWERDAERAAAHGFYGIKIHPVLDHYAVERAALDAVFAAAQAHGWPILTHADADGTSMSAGRYEPLIRAYPEVPLILAHLRVEAIPLARRFENVYVDTTYVEPLMVEVGLAALGAGKILFGSDAAEGFDVGRPPARPRPPRSYASLIAGLRARGIGERDLRPILYENARSLFRIEQALA